ncbi:ATP-binding protein [Candidatus Pacearchaeota archaeon]|nr:ATP-binding protein [Candidatus Pacearchaeota archaeon]
MDPHFSQSPFLNIPRKKLDDALDDILEAQSNNGILTPGGAALTTAFTRYYEANIPVDYWWREMDGWSGPDKLTRIYLDITKDIKASYKSGEKAFFAGKHGIGKTYISCCILKRAVEKQYSALYVNLTDIIHIMLNSSPQVKSDAREILLNVDFLVIDEFDARFMGSENAADLFGRILEPIMRTRIQNRMPLFFCTNSVKVEESFSGPLRASIESLMKVVKLVPIIGGQDMRDMIKKGEL